MDMILGLVADAANKGEGEKLNVLGIFHTIYTNSIPHAHSHLALALEFKAAPYDKGKTFDIRVRLLDPDSVQIFQIELKLGISSEAPALEPIAPLALNLHNVVFPKYGNYRFEVEVNNTPQKEVLLEVISLEQLGAGAE